MFDKGRKLVHRILPVLILFTLVMVGCSPTGEVKDYIKKPATASVGGKQEKVEYTENSDGENMEDTNKGMNFHFDSRISREVLNNYLSRAVTHNGLGDASDGNSATFEDDMRMLLNIGAKFIGRTAYVWGLANDEEHYKICRERAEKVHELDPEIILQACVFEAIYRQHVDETPVPDWVFKAFGLEPEKRNFRYQDMIYEDGLYVNHWGPEASVQDINRLESQMWIYYRACRYIQAGYEAIHFGQVHLIGARDRGYKNWKLILDRVREFARQNARRKLVICDAHTHGILVNGELLFDFHSFPLRTKEVENKPQQMILEEGYIDSIYGRSKGGITPSGWETESLPFLVEFDNFGVSSDPGVKIADDHWAWGYDEISWFARQPEEYRNEFIEYAWNWVRSRYKEGWVQFPARRLVASQATINYEPTQGKFDMELFERLEKQGEYASYLASEGLAFDLQVRFYKANRQSDAVPHGFGQEETIKRIWNNQ